MRPGEKHGFSRANQEKLENVSLKIGGYLSNIHCQKILAILFPFFLPLIKTMVDANSLIGLMASFGLVCYSSPLLSKVNWPVEDSSLFVIT